MILTLAILTAISTPSVFALQAAKIQLKVSNDRPLRGSLIRVSGRLSTIEDDRPIALAKIRLQYYRADDPTIVRDLTEITSNPSGLFEDILNTTSLLRIGPWIVNASFQTQFGYAATSVIAKFTVVVQPELSLYISPRTIPVGGNLSFNGLLFACIPCLTDQVIVEFTRPDGINVTMHVSLVATGGPYPGGYYQGNYTLDMLGSWHVQAIWEGNNVTLPAVSQVEEVTVGPAGSSFPEYEFVIILLVVLASAGLVWRLGSGKKERKRRG